MILKNQNNSALDDQSSCSPWAMVKQVHVNGLQGQPEPDPIDQNAMLMVFPNSQAAARTKSGFYWPKAKIASINVVNYLKSILQTISGWSSICPNLYCHAYSIKVDNNKSWQHGKCEMGQHLPKLWAQAHWTKVQMSNRQGTHRNPCQTF